MLNIIDNSKVGKDEALQNDNGTELRLLNPTDLKDSERDAEMPTTLRPNNSRKLMYHIHIVVEAH